MSENKGKIDVAAAQRFLPTTTTRSKGKKTPTSARWMVTSIFAARLQRMGRPVWHGRRRAEQGGRRGHDQDDDLDGGSRARLR
jgi:hypothetical protein